MKPTPNIFAIQIRSGDDWNTLSTYSFDSRIKGRGGSRDVAFREARKALTAWQTYGDFGSRQMRIVECPIGMMQPEWREAVA